MIEKQIIWFGEKAVLSCDGKCEKAKGINKGFIIAEGGHIKPINKEHRLNKWCARECERSKIKEV